MEGTAVFGWYPVPFIYTIRARSSTEKSTALGGEGEGRASEGLFNDAASLPPAVAAAMLRDGNGSDRNHAMRCGRRTGASGRAGEGPWTSEPMHEADRHNSNAPPLSPSSLRAHPFSPRAARNSDNEAYLMWAASTGGATTHSVLAVHVEQTILP